MSRRKKRPAPAAPAPAPKKENKFLDFVKKNKKTIIISATAAVLVIAFVIGLIAVILSRREFDYMSTNLSPYITISAEDYKNYSVTVAKDTVDDTDVARAINKLLFEHKSEEPYKDGALILSRPVAVGDIVHLYYRGYTVDGDGKVTDIDGACNFADDDEYQLGIGSGGFIYGFEDGLIGMIPKDHKSFSKITSGNVSQGKVAYLSGSVLYPDGSAKQSFINSRIDLTDPETSNKLWGEDFVEYLTGGLNSSTGNNFPDKEIGKKLDTVTFPYEKGSAVYYDLTVSFVTTCEDDPYTVETVFPIDYSEKSLRGKKVIFDVYVDGLVHHDVPAYDDDFITEKLELTADELSKYEGTTLTEKHTAKVRLELEEELIETRNGVIEEAMWDHYYSKANIKKLPEYEVRAQYGVYYEEIQNMYPAYSSQYDSVDAFARAYYGLGSNEDWRSYITAMAKNVVAEKLIFYAVVRAENIIPTEEEYNKLYEETVAEQLEYYINDLYSDELDKIEDRAEKDARIAEIKAEMLDYYGTAYFKETVQYSYALDKLLSFATVTEE